MQNPSESRDPGKQVCRSDLKQAIERQIKNKVRGQEVDLIATMMTLAENCSKCGKKTPSDRDKVGQQGNAIPGHFSFYGQKKKGDTKPKPAWT